MLQSVGVAEQDPSVPISALRFCADKLDSDLYFFLCKFFLPVREPPYLFLKRKSKSVDLNFYLAGKEMKEEKLEALGTYMDILNTGLGVCHIFLMKII